MTMWWEASPAAHLRKASTSRSQVRDPASPTSLPEFLRRRVATGSKFLAVLKRQIRKRGGIELPLHGV